MSFPKWVEDIFQAEQDKLEEGVVANYDEDNAPDIDPRYLILLGDEEEEDDTLVNFK